MKRSSLGVAAQGVEMTVFFFKLGSHGHSTGQLVDVPGEAQAVG